MGAVDKCFVRHYDATSLGEPALCTDGAYPSKHFIIIITLYARKSP